MKVMFIFAIGFVLGSFASVQFHPIAKDGWNRLGRAGHALVSSADIKH